MGTLEPYPHYTCYSKNHAYIIYYFIVQTMTSLNEESLQKLQDLIAYFAPSLSNIKDITHDRPFNILLDASDYYYRENLHSQLIASILTRAHFRELFIAWLNNHSKDQQEICADKYVGAEVKLESDKIDILIQCTSNKHCIIIENKINGAIDMARQIPRYVEKKKGEGYHVDAVVYLTLDDGKRPNALTWKREDHELLSNIRLIYAAAKDNSTTDMLNGFFRPCLLKSQSIQEESYLKQYCDLIEFLGVKSMDSQTTSKFYEQIISDENFKVIQKISELYQYWPTYRRDAWFDFFKNNYKPFGVIYRWSSNYTGFEGVSHLTNERLKLDIVCEPAKTRIIFHVMKETEHIDGNIVADLLAKINLTSSFTNIGENRYECLFDFPKDEDKVGEMVKRVFDGLNKIVT